MVSQAAGLPIEDIKWHMPNTATSPDAGTTSGSRQTTLTGEAARRAARPAAARPLCRQGPALRRNEPCQRLPGRRNGRKRIARYGCRPLQPQRLRCPQRSGIHRRIPGKTDKMGADVPHPVSHVAYGYATHVCILNDDGTIRKMVAATTSAASSTARAWKARSKAAPSWAAVMP